MHGFIERHFIWIMLAFSIIAVSNAALFTWLKPFIPILLGIIMLGIGFTLNSSEFQRTWHIKWSILIVIILKYITMPLIAYMIGIALKLPLPELIGIIIIGACPGGTAANVMAYLSSANITLTVTLTLGTTLIAPLVMPALIYLFLHKHIAIPFLEIFKSLLFIVLLPVTTGMIIKSSFLKKASPLIKVFPAISIIAIALVIACVISLTPYRASFFSGYILMAVTLLNLIGYLVGWLIAKLMGNDAMERKSIAFEYGMFDTGLGVVIATSFFTPLAAIPGALLSIIQNLTAAIIIKRMKKRQLQTKQLSLRR